MLTRDQALELARKYLGRRSVELEISEGWPPDGACCPFGDQPSAVWSIFVASDVTGVGAGHYIIVDANSGEVVSDQRCGE